MKYGIRNGTGDIYWGRRDVADNKDMGKFGDGNQKKAKALKALESDGGTVKLAKKKSKAGQFAEAMSKIKK